MRPLIEDGKGVRFQSREAIRYKDGTAKLWSLEQKDPVAPTLRHKGPIRELTFFDESNLLITLSDESVKVWDGLTGEPRKELEGQTISPMWLSFAPGAKRFVTMDSERKAVTVWDAVTLDGRRHAASNGYRSGRRGGSVRGWQDGRDVPVRARLRRPSYGTSRRAGPSPRFGCRHRPSRRSSPRGARG